MREGEETVEWSVYWNQLFCKTSSTNLGSLVTRNNMMRRLGNEFPDSLNRTELEELHELKNELEALDAGTARVKE
ncbi:hypothetical protein TorRG33x02_317580 [Trema orientale]|uniref:Uncharacterized protein n=1 Tax=Trema orientale TaxID=63057 RepID=A0A2P5BKS9_TREOI|nr:hypothetical protein TorRG33x02_317580 [Trema orientale]